MGIFCFSIFWSRSLLAYSQRKGGVVRSIHHGSLQVNIYQRHRRHHEIYVHGLTGFGGFKVLHMDCDCPCQIVIVRCDDNIFSFFRCEVESSLHGEDGLVGTQVEVLHGTGFGQSERNLHQGSQVAELEVQAFAVGSLLALGCHIVVRGANHHIATSVCLVLVALLGVIYRHGFTIQHNVLYEGIIGGIVVGLLQPPCTSGKDGTFGILAQFLDCEIDLRPFIGQNSDDVALYPVERIASYGCARLGIGRNEILSSKGQLGCVTFCFGEGNYRVDFIVGTGCQHQDSTCQQGINILFHLVSV